MVELKTIDQSLPKEKVYELLLKQIKAITHGENDLIANLSNISSILKYEMKWFWVGFYLVKNNRLILGPFQGPVACTQIPIGKGVCGTVVKTNQAIIVPNVNEFEGHIACSSQSKSEIVLPLRNSKNECIGVLDVDSEMLNNFDIADEKGLTEIVNHINQLF